MPNDDWSLSIGLRNATLSLLWRTVVAAVIWCGGLWSFFALLTAIGVTTVPMLIAIGFAALAGTIVGVVISRGLEEKAGFVSPLLTLLTAAFAAVAIIGGEALFARVSAVATGHLRYIIVGTTMVVACAWIAKHTLFDT